MENENIKNKFIGVWELVSLDMKNLNGEPQGKFESKGRIIYDGRGFMAVQIMGLNRPHFKSGNQDEGTNEEIKQAFINTTTYYGTYEIDEEKGVVTHHIEASLFPNWEGTAQERIFKLSEDQLELIATILEEQTEYILTWKKLK